MIFLFLEKPFKKKKKTQISGLFIFFLMAAAHRQARDANMVFFTFLHDTSDFYYHITYLLFFTIAMFPGLLVMETEKKKNCEHNKP